MVRKQVLVQLDDEQVARLDGIAAGDSRSELIRHAIDLFLEAVEEAVADLRYAEAYERIPEDLEDLADLRALGMRAWPEG